MNEGGSRDGSSLALLSASPARDHPPSSSSRTWSAPFISGTSRRGARPRASAGAAAGRSSATRQAENRWRKLRPTSR